MGYWTYLNAHAFPLLALHNIPARRDHCPAGQRALAFRTRLLQVDKYAAASVSSHSHMPGLGIGNARGGLLGAWRHDGLELGGPLLSRVELGLSAEELGEVDVDLPREDLVVMAPDLGGSVWDYHGAWAR